MFQEMAVRIQQLQAEDRSLSPVHAQRIASLELQLAEARREARVDVVTGVLNERAMLDDESEGILGWCIVMRFPDVQLVYDRCGQESGNVFATDMARALDAAARKLGGTLYRVGTAKFAAFAPDEASVRALAKALEAIRVARDGSPSPDRRSPLERHLDEHPDSFGAQIRFTAGE